MTFVWGLRGEITKLRSLRSTYVTLVVMITATAGLGALISLAIAANWHSISPSERALFDPSASSLEGMPFGQLIVAVLGALTISTEYSTGMIRTVARLAHGAADRVGRPAQPHRLPHGEGDGVHPGRLRRRGSDHRNRLVQTSHPSGRSEAEPLWAVRGGASLVR